MVQEIMEHQNKDFPAVKDEFNNNMAIAQKAFDELR